MISFCSLSRVHLTACVSCRLPSKDKLIRESFYLKWFEPSVLDFSEHRENKVWVSSPVETTVTLVKLVMIVL